MANFSVHFIRACVSGIKNLEDRQKIIAKAGITPSQFEDDDYSISDDQFVTVVQSTWQLLNDEFLGLTDQRCKLGFFAIVANAVSQQVTLGDAYREWVKIYRIAREDSDLSFEKQGDSVLIGFSLVNPELDKMHFLSEVSLMTLHRFGCWLTGVPIPLEAVHFDYEEPAHSKFYPYIFAATPNFNQEMTALQIPSHYMDLPLIRTAEEIQEAVKTAPRSFMNLPDDVSYSNKVAKLMLQGHQSADSFPSLKEIAEELHINQRTLRRKLQHENSSYQQVKNQVRKNLAMDKLKADNINLEELAFELGFSTQQSFSRAFKRWTELTPCEYLSKKEQLSIHNVYSLNATSEVWPQKKS